MTEQAAGGVQETVENRKQANAERGSDYYSQGNLKPVSEKITQGNFNSKRRGSAKEDPDESSRKEQVQNQNPLPSSSSSATELLEDSLTWQLSKWPKNELQPGATTIVAQNNGNICK